MCYIIKEKSIIEIMDRILLEENYKQSIYISDTLKYSFDIYAHYTVEGCSR